MNYDFERAALLLNIIHSAIGVPQATAVAIAAADELGRMNIVESVPARAIPSDEPELDLSGKPVETPDVYK
jgi:hypothetical protein